MAFLLSQRRSLEELYQNDRLYLFAPIVKQHIDVLEYLLSAGVFISTSRWAFVIAGRCCCTKSLKLLYRTVNFTHAIALAAVQVVMMERLDILESIYADYDDQFLHSLGALQHLVRTSIRFDYADIFLWLMKSKEINFWQLHRSTAFGSQDGSPIFLLEIIFGRAPFHVLTCLLDEIATGVNIWEEFNDSHLHALSITSSGRDMRIPSFNLIVRRGLILDALPDDPIQLALEATLRSGDLETAKLFVDLLAGNPKRRQNLIQRALSGFPFVPPSSWVTPEAYSSGIRLLVELGASFKFYSLKYLFRSSESDLALWASHRIPEDVFQNSEQVEFLFAQCALHKHWGAAELIFQRARHITGNSELGNVLFWACHDDKLDVLQMLTSHRFGLSFKDLGLAHWPGILKTRIVSNRGFHKLLLHSFDLKEFAHFILQVAEFEPFDMAIKHNFLELLQYLLSDAGSMSDLNGVPRSTVALFIAIRHSSIEAFDCIVESTGIDVAIARLDEVEALHYALKNKASQAMVDHILDLAPSLIDAENKECQTPLLVACTLDTYRFVKPLLQRGASPFWTDASNNNAVSLLLGSDHEGKIELLQELLETHFPRSMYNIDHIKTVIDRDYPESLEFLLEQVFPNFAATTDHMNLERFRGMLVRAVQVGSWDSLLWLAERFPDRLPPNLLLDWRGYYNLGPGEGSWLNIEWRRLYPLGLVGRQLHRAPDPDDLLLLKPHSIMGHFAYDLASLKEPCKDLFLDICWSNRSLENLKQMYRHGASLDREHPNGTPLIAIASGRRSSIEEFRWVLSKGASIYEENEEYNTIQMLMDGSDDVVERFARQLRANW